jgi:hypothetical protein
VNPSEFRDIVSGQRTGLVASSIRAGLRIIEIPYTWIMRGRNVLYNRGLLPSFRVPALVISVGNLTVGGTGKTPMVQWLIRLVPQPRPARRGGQPRLQSPRRIARTTKPSNWLPKSRILHTCRTGIASPPPNKPSAATVAKSSCWTTLSTSPHPTRLGSGSSGRPGAVRLGTCAASRHPARTAVRIGSSPHRCFVSRRCHLGRAASGHPRSGQTARPPRRLDRTGSPAGGTDRGRWAETSVGSPGRSTSGRLLRDR